MPDPLNLPITVGSLPSGYCRLSAQQELNTWASLLQVQFPINYAVFNYGNSTPSADNQGSPWVRLNPDGSPDGLYVFWNGVWVRPHPIPAESSALQFYIGTAASLSTYDGGSAGVVTATTGPFWEIESAMSGRMGIGVSSDFAEGATGGARQITQQPDQVGAHRHKTGEAGQSDRNTFVYGSTSDDMPGDATKRHSEFGETNINAQGFTSTSPDPQPMNIMNPYRAGYWIKRTARIFYTA